MEGGVETLSESEPSPILNAAIDWLGAAAPTAAST
jgi:hypothetical protein